MRIVTFYVQGYVNGQATDIALMPEKALPDRLEEAEWDEDLDAFVAPERLFRHIQKNSGSCEVIRIPYKERNQK